MKHLLILIFLILTAYFSYSQTFINDTFIDKIDRGFTTRSDIESILGKGQYVVKQISNPSSESGFADNGLVKYNGLLYTEKGILFICADDGELISSIQFRSPYKLISKNLDTIEIGKTSLIKAFPLIDTFKVTTTGASKYWSFQVNNYEFYIEKPIEHQDKPHYSSIPPFKESLNYYNHKPINVVTFYLYDYNLFKKESSQMENLECSSPLYAPKIETHKNCIRHGWPDNIPVLLRPFYGLLGGQKSKIIKQGYWKEYSPSHKLVYEGEFKDNEKIGTFKYYNKHGEIEKIENYNQSIFNLRTIFIFIVGIVSITFISRLIRKRNAA